MQDLMGDGYLFNAYKRTASAKYYRCTFSRRGCPVRVITRHDGPDITQSGIHNHEPNFALLPYLRERQAIVDQARRLDVATLQEIFNARRNIDGPFSNLLTYHRLWPAMNRARISVLPVVQNLREFVEVLENPTYACVTATSGFAYSIYGGSVETAIGSRVVLFISSRCKDILMTIEDLFVHTTRVSEQYWICSVAGQLERMVVQLGWLVMDDVSEITLTAGFSLLKSLVPTNQLRSALCGDDELARVLTDVFGICVLPSLFDYIHDLKKFVRTSTLISALIIAQSQKLREVLNHCCSLPLLPPEFLQLGINIILSEYAEFASFVQSGLQNLFQYITNNWLQHPIKGCNFSVSASNKRTNFKCEEMKLKAERHFQNTADLYNLTARLVSQTEKTHTLIGNIVDHRDVPLDPIALVDIDQVRVLTEDLRNSLLPGPIAIKNFLSILAEMLQHVNF